MDNDEIYYRGYLHSLDHVSHWNALFELNYVKNPEGIFTATCPPEALHALENGILILLSKGSFRKNLTKKACCILDDHIY